MNETRLIKLLRSLNKKELKSLGNFVNSPFLKPDRKHTSKLYIYLTEYLPDLNSGELSKEQAFTFIFEGEKYNEKKILNLITDLTNSVEQFLAFSALMEDELEFKLSLSKGYMRKNLSDESNRINDLIEKKLKPSFSPFADYFSKLKRLNNLKFVHYNSNKDLSNIKKCLEGVFEAAVLQFIFEYMNFIDNIENPLNQIQNLKDENKIISGIRRIINPADLISLLEFNESDTDYLKLHYCRFRTILNKEDDTNYHELKKLFFRILVLPENDESYLDREERNLFFIFLMNYCNIWLLKDEQKYKKEILDLNKMMLEYDSYSAEGEYLNVSLYRNMIHLSNSQKDFEFLNDLLKKYINYLHPDYRTDMNHLGYAVLEFSGKQFDKSLEHLSKIKDYSIQLVKTDIKNLQLKIYYELSCYEQGFSLISSYKSYLSSTKEIDEVFINAYKDYADVCYELLKIKSGKGIESLRKLKQRIQEEIHPGFRPWLLEKAAELDSKFNRSGSHN